MAQWPAVGVHPILEEALTTPTSALALWLARFILLLHGGTLTVVPGGNGEGLHLTLPRST